MTTSSDGRHRAEQTYAGEIRFGPAFYSLAIDGRTVPNRIFGAPLQWSGNSRFLATQEWLTTHHELGPVTCAAIIDAEAWKIARLAVLRKGFAEGFRFDGATLLYRQTFLATGQNLDANASLFTINEWQDIGR